MRKDEIVFKAGEPARAADMNELVRMVRQSLKITAASPLEVSHFGNTTHIRLGDIGVQGFWAKLTGVDYTDKTYSWEKCSVHEDTGILTADADLGSGSTSDDFGWAKEATAWQFCPTASAQSIVWMWPSGKNYVFNWQRKEVWAKKVASGTTSDNSTFTATIYPAQRGSTSTGETVTGVIAVGNVVGNASAASAKWLRVWWEGDSVYASQVQC